MRRGFTTQNASSIPFDPGSTEYTATDVQEALYQAISFGGGFHYLEDETESSTTSTTFIIKTQISIPDAVAGTYLLSWASSIKTPSGNSKSMELQVVVDDTTELTSATIQDTNANWDVRSGFRRLDLAAGTHTLSIRYRSIAGTANIRRARLSIWRVTNA